MYLVLHTDLYSSSCINAFISLNAWLGPANQSNYDITTILHEVLKKKRHHTAIIAATLRVSSWFLKKVSRSARHGRHGNNIVVKQFEIANETAIKTKSATRFNYGELNQVKLLFVYGDDQRWWWCYNLLRDAKRCH